MTQNKIPTDEKFQAWLKANDFVPKYTQGHMHRQYNTLMRYEILDYLESAYSLGQAAGREEQRERDAKISEGMYLGLSLGHCDCPEIYGREIAKAIRAQGEEEKTS